MKDKKLYADGSVMAYATVSSQCYITECLDGQERTRTCNHPAPTAAPPATSATAAPPATSAPSGNKCSEKTKPKYDYKLVLEKSLLFYEAQRSGKLPADNRIPWRGDSAMTDGQTEGYDLTGGYYDAGDFVKFGFPMAGTITVLAWGMIDYRSGYDCAGETDHGYATVKWGTDYFIKAHVSDYKFFGQCGDGDVDHAYWGRPEVMTMKRPCWAITTSCKGSEILGETSAALAAASILFKTKDPAYSAKCLKHAKQLYKFAKNYKGDYHNCIHNAGKFYKSWSGYWDELAWSAAWLYKATGEDKYRQEADGYMTSSGQGFSTPSEFSWDGKWPGAQILMYKETKDAKYLTPVKQFCQNVANPNVKPKHTPKGLPFIAQWGSLRYAANAAFICLQVAESGADVTSNNCLAVKTMGYILGDTDKGSFVVGYGENPPQRPHHASSDCPSTGACGWEHYKKSTPNTHVLHGALVGGPKDKNDYYQDLRTDYIMNEVTTDYNAGFSSLLAGLIQLHNDENVSC